MLYTSVLPGIGPGLLWTYGAEAEAIGIGRTGGGPDIPGHPQVPALDWEAFSRDLRLAWHWRDDLLIHSLEGCVQQGFLKPLRTFDWARTEPAPPSAATARSVRLLLKVVLWASTHLWLISAAAVAPIWALVRRR